MHEPTADGGWRSCLNADPTDWLLEPGNPCVRYLTLTRILDAPEDDADVVKTKAEVARWAPAQKALAALGNLPWDLDNLAKIGIPPELPEVRRACEHWLEAPIYDERPRREPRRIPPPLHYFSQYVGALARLGWHADPRLTAKVEHIAAQQRLDDGNRPGADVRRGGVWCFGSHCCMAGAARALWAVAGVPEGARSPGVSGFLARGREFVAAHNLYQANHHGYKPIVKSWAQLHLPFALGWHADVLDMLMVGTELGLGDHPCCLPALRAILAKQNERGRWSVEHAYAGSYDELVGTALRGIEAVGDESKWITAHALIQLRKCESLLPRLGEDAPASPSPGADRFAAYGQPDTDADERRVRAEWADVGMTPVLGGLLGFARERELLVGWRWGLALGPEWCREWGSARARKVPARNIKSAWPVVRFCFLAPRGVLTAEGLSARLAIPLRDDYDGGRRKRASWIDATLWRIGVTPWGEEWDDVGITIRESGKVAGVLSVAREALEAFAAAARPR